MGDAVRDRGLPSLEVAWSTGPSGLEPPWSARGPAKAYASAPIRSSRSTRWGILCVGLALSWLGCSPRPAPASTDGPAQSGVGEGETRDAVGLEESDAGSDALGTGAVGEGRSDGEGSGGVEVSLRTFVYVGSGDWGPGEPGRVTVYRLNRRIPELELVEQLPAGGLASFLAIDEVRRRLFVADEVDGGLISFSIDPATGRLTNRGKTAHNSHPVYLSATSDGAYLLAANYVEGNVDVYPVDGSGKAGASLGATPTGEQAHSVVIDAKGRVFVANKKANTISRFTFAGGRLNPGSPPSAVHISPRHIFLKEERAYVVAEDADTITAYAVGAGADLNELWQVPRLPPGQSGTGADVRVTPNGHFLYATNRDDSNTLVAYDIRGERPILIEHQSTRGATPRNFAIDPESQVLIVANHGAKKTLVIFTIEPDGRLTHESTLDVGFSPFFVGFARF